MDTYYDSMMVLGIELEDHGVESSQVDSVCSLQGTVFEKYHRILTWCWCSQEAPTVHYCEDP
jgi:hypothetical protein